MNNDDIIKARKFNKKNERFTLQAMGDALSVNRDTISPLFLHLRIKTFSRLKIHKEND